MILSVQKSECLSEYANALVSSSLPLRFAILKKLLKAFTCAEIWSGILFNSKYIADVVVFLCSFSNRLQKDMCICSNGLVRFDATGNIPQKSEA